MGTSQSKNKNKNKGDQKKPVLLQTSPPPQFLQVQQPGVLQQNQNNLLIDKPIKSNNQDEQYLLNQEDPVVLSDLKQDSIQQFDIDAKMVENLENFKCNLIPLQNTIKLSAFQKTLPIVLQVQALKAAQKQQKVAIDLVCVVDISGSMEGEKLDLVKDSLRYIMKVLSPEDRISLVTFATISSYNLPFLRNTPENKERIKQAILQMKVTGSTNISEGFDKGLWLIKNRKYKNPVTCMFLLSDGQDDNKGADVRCADLITKYQIQDTFAVNTFGYGTDHDAKVMNSIAQLKGGVFTFIEDVKKASEHFILAMSGMLSVFARNIHITIQSIQPFKISQVFGDEFMWVKLDDNRYQLNINYILAGQEKEYIFQILLPIATDNQIDQATAVKAHLTGEFIQIGQKFEMHNDMIMKFSQQEVNEVNPFVEINYLRTKAGEVIGQARKLAQEKQFDSAIQLLNKMIDELEGSNYVNENQIKVTIEDLKQVKTVCTPQVFQQQGIALMLNKQQNHVQRQYSLNNSLEWNSDQEEQMDCYKKGGLQLSCCGNEDRDDAEFEGLPINNLKFRNRSKSPDSRRRSFNSNLSS